MTGWEIVHDEPLARVRRMAVPGGWLYQVEIDHRMEKHGDGEVANLFGWLPPVFVPDPFVPDPLVTS